MPCDGGIKMTLRKCNNPTPQYGGDKCPGQEYFNSPCNEQPCPCNTFKLYYLITTIIFNTAVHQSPTENPRTFCFTARGTWTNWSQYTSCSKSCGIGTKSRSRTCEGGTKCVGIENPQSLNEETSCNDGQCPGNIIVQ